MSVLLRVWLELRARLATSSGDDGGASLVEYALLLALIGVVCLVALQFLGGETSDQFSRIGSDISSANN